MKKPNYGDLFEGKIKILGDWWIIQSSGRGYVYVKKIGSDDIFVEKQIPEKIQENIWDRPEEWRKQMEKIRDMAIAEARKLAKNLKKGAKK